MIHRDLVVVGASSGGGTLFEINESAAVRYRCRVGHGCSEPAMLSAQTASTERALCGRVLDPPEHESS